MAAERSSAVSGRRSCATQTPSSGEAVGTDSLLEYFSASEGLEGCTELAGEEAVAPPAEKAPAPVPAASGGPVPSVPVRPDSPSLAAPPGRGAEEPAAGTAAGAAEGAGTRLPACESLPSERPAAGAAAAGTCAAGSPGPARREALPGVAAVPAPAGDGSSELGACTAGEGSGARVGLGSRALNAELTVLDKAPPGQRPRQTFPDAAANTELPLGARGSGTQEQQESKEQLHPWDSEMGAARPEELTQQSGKKCGSVCCQNLQRATEAELQLLSIQHEMCFQHCLKLYNCGEDIEFFSPLALGLEELDRNYKKMRVAISRGTPLAALPPLAVEVKFPPISFSYVPSKYLGKKLHSDDLPGEGQADPGRAKLQEQEVSATMDKAQSAADEPRGSASPETWEEQLLQTLERSIVRTEEGSERWFDAREDLSASGFSAVHKKETKQQGKQDLTASGEEKTVERGNERCPPVGGPAASVPQDPGEGSLQNPSTSSSTASSGIFFSPYALNLSSFSKLLRRLQERHPEANRDRILEALQEVRRNHKGVLSGLSVSAIEEESSATLRRRLPCARGRRQ